MTVALKNFHASGMISDQFGFRFKMLPIVELTELGGENFKLGLYLKNFSFEIVTARVHNIINYPFYKNQYFFNFYS